MNIGTICYATKSGLGHLAKMFYDEGIINRILIIDHPRYEKHKEWYKESDRYSRFTAESFLKDLDCIIIFENVFTQWGLVNTAKKRGIKVVLVPMYEWTPNPLPVSPDLVLCPSLLDIKYFDKYKWVYINIPAPRLEWKQRTKATLFVHNAGHGQVGYAKGTPEVLEAMKYVKSNVRLLVRGQKREPRIQELFNKYSSLKNVEFVHNDIPYEELFSIGDVYINAERYNGLSLPLQEAYSSGMLVMTTNRFPANNWLPNDPLIPVQNYSRHRVNQTDFDMATVDPIQIARCIDEWYDKDITEYSNKGREWAQIHSWENLKPKYLAILQSIIG